VQIQPNASIALFSVLSCFDFTSSKRNKIVASALDFPSMQYILDAQTPVGARVEMVPSDDGIVIPMERILDAIDNQTALVAISHVSFRSSYRVEVEAIMERARQYGALVLLDVYQSAGAVELKARDWEVDFLIGGTIKWLCGGPACGYLYVRPDLQNQLQPRLTGWVAHDAPFEFAPRPMRYDHSVRRFAQGTPGIPALYSVLPGLKMIEEVGVKTVRAESVRRTEIMIEFALAHGWKVNSPHDVNQRGGSVMIYVEDGPAMVKRLAERKVFVDCRPGVGLRMSSHFFNTDEEVREAMEILAELTDL
jgi:kynureninase